jgi:plasmid stabilization system protein ParE
MSHRLVLRPAALGDIAAIGDWYDQRNDALRDAFLGAIDAALAKVAHNPFQYQVVYRQYRRVPVSRFPYALFYIVSDSEIIVIACIHGHRNLTRALRQR